MARGRTAVLFLEQSRLLGAYLRLAPVVGVILLGFALLWIAILTLEAARLSGALGIDWQCNAAAARSWLGGDGYFHPRQLAGPYFAQHATAQDLGEVLYPPTALYLFVPFTYLPDLAWWMVPAGLTIAALRQLRPSRWTWPILALLFGASANVVVAGNPSIWVVPATLGGLLLGWPASLVFLKPSVFPFAFVGAFHRSWWVGLVVIIVASLPFGHLWLDWVAAVTDMREASIFYSVVQWPLLGITLVVGLDRMWRRTSRPLVTEILEDGVKPGRRARWRA